MLLISVLYGVLFFLHRGLHLAEQTIQAAEGSLPEPAILLQPFAGFPQRLGHQPARPALRVTIAGNQPSAFQNLQVLGDGGLGHGEGLDQFFH